jgi:hypothetical protein
MTGFLISTFRWRTLDVSMDIFRNIFDWSNRLTPDDIPRPTLFRARLQILNMLAAAMEGLRSEHAAKGPDPLWRLTSASMIHDFDDFLYFSHSGHSSVFVPLVLGCIEDASLGDVLAAQVAANEVAGRLGARLLVGPHNGQMWSTTHVPATIAAAGRLLRIDPGTLSTAAGLALSHPPFVIPQSFFSSSAKFFTAAVPIRTSLALLASAGTKPRAGVPSSRGFFRRFSWLPIKPALGRPGETWLTDTLHFKRYPACAYAQAGIDAALKVDARPDDIRRIAISADPLALAMEAWNARHSSDATPFVVQAGFSLKTSAAVCLTAGRFACDVLTDGWRDRNASGLRSLVKKTSVRLGPRQGARFAAMAASIAAVAAGLRPVDAARLEPMDLVCGMRIALVDGSRIAVEGRFPSYRRGDEEGMRAMVVEKYAGAHRRFGGRSDPESAVEAVMGGSSETPIRSIVRASLGKTWLESILGMDTGLPRAPRGARPSRRRR